MNLPETFDFTLTSFAFCYGSGNEESLIRYNSSYEEIGGEWTYWPGVGCGETAYSATFESLLEAIDLSFEDFKNNWKLVYSFSQVALGRDLGVSYSSMYHWTVLWGRRAESYEEALEIAIRDCEGEIKRLYNKLSELDEYSMDAPNLDYQEEQTLYLLYDREERLDWLKRFPKKGPTVLHTLDLGA